MDRFKTNYDFQRLVLQIARTDWNFCKFQSQNDELTRTHDFQLFAPRKRQSANKSRVIVVLEQVALIRRSKEARGQWKERKSGANHQNLHFLGVQTKRGDKGQNEFNSRGMRIETQKPNGSIEREPKGGFKEAKPKGDILLLPNQTGQSSIAEVCLLKGRINGLIIEREPTRNKGGQFRSKREKSFFKVSKVGKESHACFVIESVIVLPKGNGWDRKKPRGIHKASEQNRFSKFANGASKGR